MAAKDAKKERDASVKTIRSIQSALEKSRKDLQAAKHLIESLQKQMKEKDDMLSILQAGDSAKEERLQKEAEEANREINGKVQRLEEMMEGARKENDKLRAELAASKARSLRKKPKRQRQRLHRQLKMRRYQRSRSSWQ